MEIIPFRIEASKEEYNYSDVYAFLIKGTTKDAYEVEIDIDSLNDKGITDTRCTCPDFIFRQNTCKHINCCISILKQFQIETEIEEYIDMSTFGKPVTPTVVIEKSESVFINKAHFEPCGKVFETDLIHKDGTKDKLVCRCGGEDGLCDTCAVQIANSGGKDVN